MPDRTEILAKIDEHIEQHVDQYIEQLAKLVAQPSVAAQNEGIDECAELVAVMLDEQGIHAEIMPTGGSPVVYGEHDGTSDKTLIFYLHYDVQPAEPLELWKSPPWELTRRGDRLFGRGISDDKGHIIARLAAVDAVKNVMGELPCRVKFLIEGEEEIGSINLPEFVEEHKEKLASDVCIWEFGGVNVDNQPEQVLGMRGICYVELSTRTAKHDAHSGLGGSIFPNAAWRLVWALNTLKDEDEHILIPGFYDDVAVPSERDIALLKELPENQIDWMLEHFELAGFLNEMIDPLEIQLAAVFQPTCTICGLTSGYQGKGTKTVLPAEARAKVDFRLVPDQMPGDIIDKLRKHLDEHGFEDIEVTFLGGEPPGRTDPDDPFIKLVNEAAEEVYGVAPLVKPIIGGSGPNHAFLHHLEVPIATSGVGYPGSAAHAPNENIVIQNFIDGIKHTAHILVNYGLEIDD